MSFSVPQRKKLNLQVSANRKSEGVRAVAPGSSDAEFGLPWSEVEHVLCLPVPEKAQAQRNFCVFPRGGDGVATAPAGSGEGGSPFETMVWTAPDTRPKGAAEDEATQAGKTVAALEKAGWNPQQPDAKEFASEVPQPGRKGEKAYHVKAFKGSKDGEYTMTLIKDNWHADALSLQGYLFFLPQGILWGFKKPLILFSFPVVDSISYTSVLQRTFNLVIAARASADAPPQEHEFSMLDQADYAGIDAYVRRHGLQDASLAEARRAKKYNVNGVKRDGEDGVGEGENGEEEESELVKAHREAEMRADEEEDDENDENFDPGSEGESEGRGTSDEEDEGGEGGGGEGDEDDGEDNAATDELGSEAEEVEMDDE